MIGCVKMKKYILILVFVIGLGIFSYPIISNYFSTKTHQSAVKQYREAVEQMDYMTIEDERKKATKHNEKLKSAQLNYVDPFSEQAADAPENSGNKSYYDALNVGPAIGNLEIPKINVQLPMYHGTNDDVLSRGVGHLENSSLPTGELGTHSVFTAHRGLPSSKLFRDIDQLKVGDEFFIEVLNEKYAYEVYEVDIVLPHETDWLQMDDDEELVTLLTCEPYMINTHRMLVKGKRVPYSPEKTTTNLPEQRTAALGAPWYFIAASAGVIMLIVIFLRLRKAGRRP